MISLPSINEIQNKINMNQLFRLLLGDNIMNVFHKMQEAIDTHESFLEQAKRSMEKSNKNPMYLTELKSKYSEPSSMEQIISNHLGGVDSSTKNYSITPSGHESSLGSSTNPENMVIDPEPKVKPEPQFTMARRTVKNNKHVYTLNPLLQNNNNNLNHSNNDESSIKQEKEKEILFLCRKTKKSVKNKPEVIKDGKVRKPRVCRARGSRYRGVSRNGNLWQVLIMVDKKKRYVGSYKNELEAAKSYDIAAIQNHLHKAKTNFIYSKAEIHEILEGTPLLVIESKAKTTLKRFRIRKLKRNHTKTVNIIKIIIK